MVLVNIFSQWGTPLQHLFASQTNRKVPIYYFRGAIDHRSQGGDLLDGQPQICFSSHPPTTTSCPEGTSQRSHHHPLCTLQAQATHVNGMPNDVCMPIYQNLLISGSLYSGWGRSSTPTQAHFILWPGVWMGVRCRMLMFCSCPGNS